MARLPVPTAPPLLAVCPLVHEAHGDELVGELGLGEGAVHVPRQRLVREAAEQLVVMHAHAVGRHVARTHHAPRVRGLWKRGRGKGGGREREDGGTSISGRKAEHAREGTDAEMWRGC